jgi:2-dehydropantoate 2-reductase
VSALSFCERGAIVTDRVTEIDREMNGAKFGHRVSANIILEMWEKWVFLAALAGCTCLTRTAIGDLVAAPGGLELIENVLAEITMAASAAGFAPRVDTWQRTRTMLTAHGSELKASMLRDIEAGGRTEADHVIGDLLTRGEFPLLKIAYTALKAYEGSRRRLP